MWVFVTVISVPTVRNYSLLEKILFYHYYSINMKSRIIPLLFLFVAMILGGIFYVSRKYFVKGEKTLIRAKVVTPKSSESSDIDGERRTSSVEGEKYETFVPLYTGETLISTLTIDLNNDGYDDEVIIVRKSASQNLWMVAALLDPESGNYERLEPVSTEFTKTRTFSYSGMDIIGDHKTALIYQGLNDDGNYIMKIFLCKSDNDGSELVAIGDFSSDGTVFIQQTERSESYEMSLSKGESFSVWVYKSDKQSDDDIKKNNASGQNQIQQEYKWNPLSQKYELTQEIKVTAGRLAAKELSRIQDGTVETFANFLDGLWYKTSNTDGNIRYLYFNYSDKEIVQLLSDTQEVYEWESSNLRHNGLYITAVNADIMNLHRRFDIALVNVDEIKVTLHDDINLLIKENTMWDGQYKKMSLQSTFGEDKNKQTIQSFGKALKNGSWVSSDIMNTITFDDYTYEIQTNEITETGIYSIDNVGNDCVIQFRSDGENSVLNEYYSMQFGNKTITETVKKKLVETVVVDYDTVVFSPVKYTPVECFAAEGRIFTLTREEENSQVSG